MKTLTMTKGLPASGKTAWAKGIIEANPGAYKRANKDDLRAMLDGGKFSRDNEKFCLFVRDLIVVAALKECKHVIVDDTNLAPKHEERLKQLARENDARFVVQDFTDVALEVCIERDRKRHGYVGEKIIRDMWKQFLAPKPPVIKPNPALQACVIVDMDGTVALMNGRGPYEGDKCDTDLPNRPIVELVCELSKTNQILFVSGRFEAVRGKTYAWMKEYLGFTAPLYMRADGDTRQDSIIKREIYERMIAGKWNVRFVLDDRNRVVEEWRNLGLTCLQVADGGF